MELNKVFAKYFKPASYDCAKVCSDVCTKCGGECCTIMGCHIAPSDLKEISVDAIISLIDETGCISIDWWVGNPVTGEFGYKGYYLRMRNEDANIIDPAWSGHRCSILTDTGCPLSFEYRPKGARELIPNEILCDAMYPKQQCAIEWDKYHDIMSKVYEHYKKV